MGACASIKLERERKNKQITSSSQNNQSGLQKYKLQEQEQDINLKNVQNNQGQNSYPQSYSNNFQKKLNSRSPTFQNMRNDEQVQEEVHKNNYPNYPYPPNSTSMDQQQGNAKRYKIKCSTHQNMFIELVNTDNKTKQRVMCYQCQFEQKNEDKQIIQINALLEMSDNQYLDQFLVFEEPLFMEQYKQKFMKTKEIQNSYFNINLLEDLKSQIAEYIDHSIKLISESVDRLRKKQDIINQSFKNCNKLSTFKGYIFESNSNQDKLSQNITNLLSEQAKQNKQFESGLKNYFVEMKKEVQCQSNVIDNVISQLNSLTKIRKDFKTDILNQQPQVIIEKGMNQLVDVSQIKQYDNDTYKSMDISLNDSNYIQLKTCKNKFIEQINYINLELYHNKKYEMLLDFKSYDYNEGSLALFLTDNTRMNKIQYGELYIPLVSQVRHTHYQAEKGIPIHKKKSGTKNLKIQIELMNHIFRWKFDDNLNSVSDWSTFKQDQLYYILFYTCYSHSEITIKHLKEVNEFEKW